MTTATKQRSGTRDRLVREALRLFAEKGFRETTVGEVEEAAGLVPRSGALYKHFDNKQALLEAAVEQKVEDLEERRLEFLELLPLGNLRSEVTLIGRTLLQGLDDERDLVRILEQDGDAIPALRAQVAERLFQAGARLTVDSTSSISRRAPTSKQALRCSRERSSTTGAHCGPTVQQCSTSTSSDSSTPGSSSQ